ncbi:MAG TPA: geranylgeranylglyceryl/heptaprenylglyceryl phosphate synthase [Bacteroidales bacterium]|nr:geranylgeranylglyceryl/heptaprenylglyceryl phosphate synthase [Bacteroidales bacterium]
MISEFIQEHVNQKKKLFALLIDPDFHTYKTLSALIKKCNKSKVDLILVGGSLVNKNTDETIENIKQHTKIPVLLFPGSILQVSSKADGILLLSLISGRNPELLIGNHVTAAHFLKQSKLEVLPTGYILIDGGNRTSVEYMSNTQPIPADKTDIATATALAGEMLGLKYIYLEAGSGAKYGVNTKMIKAIKENIQIPVFVGGGIKTKEDIKKALEAGADIIVVGSAIEQDESKLEALVDATHE